jgi:hypothetical protein
MPNEKLGSYSHIKKIQGKQKRDRNKLVTKIPSPIIVAEGR